MDWRFPVAAAEDGDIGLRKNAHMKPQISGGEDFLVNRANMR
jgi:hypothetical protein